LHHQIYVLRLNVVDFWVKEMTVYEQPSVSYRYELMSEVNGWRCQINHAQIYAFSDG